MCWVENLQPLIKTQIIKQFDLKTLNCFLPINGKMQQV